MAAGPTGVLAHRAHLRRHSWRVIHNACRVIACRVCRDRRNDAIDARRFTLHEQRDMVVQIAGLNGNACRSGQCS